MSYLLTFILAYLLSVSIIPLVLRIARARSWYDRSSSRKVHLGKVPRLGGMGIAAAFLITTVAVYAIFAPSGRLPSPKPAFWLLMAAGLGFHLLGLADDFIDLKGRLKFLIQLGLAIAVVALGYSFTVLELPFAPYSINLGVFGPAVTVLWIVGICNAMNLIDGVDGLAGGVAFIACAVWAVLFYKDAQYLPAIAATAAGGAILGFLFYNFPPANIFMGDSGSLFLGFLLAVLPLLAGVGERADTGLLPAITIAFVPILDTISAILRRWRMRISLFTPDRFHLHHKLLNLGFTTRQVLVIIYSLCFILGASVVAGMYLDPATSFIVMIAGWVLVTIFFIILHYLKEGKVVLFEKNPEDR